MCICKVSKGAKIRNRYNQVPHLTQDTNGKVTNSRLEPQTRAKRSALSQQVTTKRKTTARNLCDLAYLCKKDETIITMCIIPKISSFFVTGMDKIPSGLICCNYNWSLSDSIDNRIYHLHIKKAVSQS